MRTPVPCQKCARSSRPSAILGFLLPLPHFSSSSLFLHSVFLFLSRECPPLLDVFFWVRYYYFLLLCIVFTRPEVAATDLPFPTHTLSSPSLHCASLLLDSPTLWVHAPQKPHHHPHTHASPAFFPFSPYDVLCFFALQSAGYRHRHTAPSTYKEPLLSIASTPPPTSFHPTFSSSPLSFLPLLLRTLPRPTSPSLSPSLSLSLSLSLSSLFPTRPKIFLFCPNNRHAFPPKLSSSVQPLLCFPSKELSRLSLLPSAFSYTHLYLSLSLSLSLPSLLPSSPHTLPRVLVSVPCTEARASVWGERSNREINRAQQQQQQQQMRKIDNKRASKKSKKNKQKNIKEHRKATKEGMSKKKQQQETTTTTTTKGSSPLCEGAAINGAGSCCVDKRHRSPKGHRSVCTFIYFCTHPFQWHPLTSLAGGGIRRMSLKGFYTTHVAAVGKLAKETKTNYEKRSTHPPTRTSATVEASLSP